MKLAVMPTRSDLGSTKVNDGDTPCEPRNTRFAAPGFKDMRWIVGVLLLIGGILGTLKVISAFDDGASVWVARHELVPGQKVAPDDFVRTQARLGESTGAYLAGSKPQGVVQRHVAAGELVPVSAVGSVSANDQRPVALSVPKAQSEAITTGDHVEVWVAKKIDQAGVARFEKPTKLLDRALVSRSTTSGSGVVSVNDTRSIEVLVPTDDLSELIDAVNSEARITLVPLSTKGQR